MSETALAALYEWMDCVAQCATLDAIWNHVSTTSLESFDQLQEERAAAHAREYSLRRTFMALLPAPVVA